MWKLPESESFELTAASRILWTATISRFAAARRSRASSRIKSSLRLRSSYRKVSSTPARTTAPPIEPSTTDDAMPSHAALKATFMPGLYEENAEAVVEPPRPCERPPVTPRVASPRSGYRVAGGGLTQGDRQRRFCRQVSGRWAAWPRRRSSRSMARWQRGIGLPNGGIGLRQVRARYTAFGDSTGQTAR